MLRHLALARRAPPPQGSEPSSVSLSMSCLKPTLCILLLGLLASKVSSQDDWTARSDSEVFPLVFNPFDVSHFKCVGYTLYENTKASSDYTYEVDVCFMAALATKLAFPWLYQYFTGQALFPQLRELGIPLLDGGASADVRGEVHQLPDYQDYYEESFQAPTIQERASTWFSELGKAVQKEPSSRQQRKRQRQRMMGDNMEQEFEQEEVNYRREPEYQQKEEEDLGQVSGFGQRDQFRERKRAPMFNY